MNKGARILLISVIAVFAVILLMQSLSPAGSGGFMGGSQVTQLNLSEFETRIDAEQIRSADWQGSTITGEFTSGGRFRVSAPNFDSQTGSELLQRLRAKGVEVDTKGPPASATFMPFLAFLLVPLLLFGLLYFFIFRPAQSGGNQAMNFGRSKAKRAGELNPKITFDDVAGIEEAKQELTEIVDFLKNTKKYVALGAKIPKGVLLTGPPGVGKTHLARAIAGEAGVPFFHISGSDFVEMFVGVGAARVRDLFETAKAHRPCLIFIDEIDAVGRQRGAGLGGGHDEREQTLNQMLVEMDGFDANNGIIMIAATNRPDVLDPALLRPGRFDRQVVVDAPDSDGREQILRIHSKGKPLDDSVDLGIVAKRSPGFTGADLANTINEAALLAARRDRTKIMMDDIEEALDRVVAGPQRKSRIVDADEREAIAYHEAGHALVGELLEHADPVHKVTILPRGMSLGSTWSIPERDKFMTSKDELLADIAMSLGGRAAEQIVYNREYTGAGGDLQRVSRVARAMVTEYGMSEKVGTLAVGQRNRNPFLGRDYGSESRDYSEEVARLIDQEVKQIVSTCYERAKQILTENRDKLDAIVQALLERETLNRTEFLAILKGEPLPEISSPKGTEQPADEGAVATDSGEEKKPQSSPRLEPGPA